MGDDQFTKLYSAITDLDKRLDKTETALRDEIGGLRTEMHLGNQQISIMHEELSTKVEALQDEVRTGYDKVAARLDIDDTERGALESQVNRHEGWIEQLAKKTDTDLVVEA